MYKSNPHHAQQGMGTARQKQLQLLRSHDSLMHAGEHYATAAGRVRINVLARQRTLELPSQQGL
jgi:hypothetical protein